MSNIFAFENLDPGRACDWAWRYAVHTAALDRHPPGLRQQHPTMFHAVRLLQAEAAGSPDQRLNTTFADIQAARRLWELHGPVELEIQARLLARESITSISTLVQQTVAVVAAYEQLFFNVTDRLNACSWVFCYAINLRVDEPDQQHAVLLRRFAYYGGPYVLEAAMPELLHGFDPDAARPDLTTEAGRLRQRLRLLIQYFLLPNDAETELKVTSLLRSRPLRGERVAAPVMAPPIVAPECASALPEGEFVQADRLAETTQTTASQSPRRKAG